MSSCVKCKSALPDGAKFCPECGMKVGGKTRERSMKKRGNGQGCVYKDQRGHYTAEITLTYLSSGKRKMKRKKGFTTKKAALKWIEDFKRGDIVPDTITINRLWDIFMKRNEDLSKSKITAYNIAYNKIKNEIEHRKIDTFTVSELQDIVDEYGSSYYTKRDIKLLLSHFYKIALQDEFVTSNKAQYIKLPKQEETERKIFTEEDISLLWADFKAQPSKVTAGMLMMIYTGMRPGELLNILCENVHLAEHYLTGGIKTEKGKNRKIIIPNRLNNIVDWLLKYREKKLCDYPYKNLFYDDWQKKRSDLKISEDLTPYCCRHTYITRLTRLQASPAMLQELAGHEDYETTLIYTHLSVDDRFDFVNKLA